MIRSYRRLSFSSINSLPSTSRSPNPTKAPQTSGPSISGRSSSSSQKLPPPALPSPRELKSHLDLYVIGQDKPKRVLSTGIFNHYTRVAQLRADEIERQAAEDRNGIPYPSFNFSVFEHEADERVIGSNQVYPTTSSPARKSNNFDRETRTKALEEIISRESLPGVGKAAEGMEGDCVEDPEPIERSTSKGRQTTFENSYPPDSSSSPTTKKKVKPIVSILPPLDPTTYDSETPPATRKRKPKPAEELLTDFPGQVSGSAPPSPPTTTELTSEKSNILLIGPTGSGKTLLAKTLALRLAVPFVAVEATGMTMAGYVGEDVETCVQKLLAASDWDVGRAEVGIICIDEIDKIARSATSSKDVSGEGVQQALLKILEGTVITVKNEEGSNGRPGKRPKESYQVDTKNILFILSGAFVGLEKMISNRLTRGSIGFTAAMTAGKNSENSATAVDILDKVEVKDLNDFGFISEFVGRLPVIASLKALTEGDLLRILTEPKNSLIGQYQELFKASDIEVRFTTLALKEIAAQAVNKGSGARGLRRILENLLLDAMFETPKSSVRYVLFDGEWAKGNSEAKYYSRGQSSNFNAEFEAEEVYNVVEKMDEDVEVEVAELKRAIG